ncbi:MAG: P27 family phage terminase small subunit [Desulfobacteraceae bacterium]|nr:P27 family phage terminase small subunit [Desulfobacteraceae bacterium]
MKLTAKRTWTKEARQFFIHIKGKFQIDEKHHAVFYGTVENLNDFYKAKELVRSDGMTFKTPSGQIRKNPACGIQKDAWSAFLLGLKALGLHEYQAKLGRPPGR